MERNNNERQIGKLESWWTRGNVKLYSGLIHTCGMGGLEANLEVEMMRIGE